MQTASDALSSILDPDCGIVAGITPDGKHAALAYFITGSDAASRNRMFALDGDDIQIKVFDQSSADDEPLNLYCPIRVLGGCTILSNGSQTDEIYQAFIKGKTFYEALKSPDPPETERCAPRLCAALTLTDTGVSYQLALIQHANIQANSSKRLLFEYPEPILGEGRLLCAQRSNKNALPDLEIAPYAVLIENNLKTFANHLWNALNETNRVSLFTRFISIHSGAHQTCIINKNY